MDADRGGGANSAAAPVVSVQATKVDMATSTPHTRRYILAFTIALVAALVDQLTKLWALHALADGSRIPLIGSYLSLRLTFNPGAAFSLGSQSTWIFTILSTIILIGLVAAVHKFASLRYAAVFGLLAGGAIGNLIDRLTQPPGFGIGHVVDFIDYNGYFVGNVADIWIVCAACSLAILAFFAPQDANTRNDASPRTATKEG